MAEHSASRMASNRRRPIVSKHQLDYTALRAAQQASIESATMHSSCHFHSGFHTRTQKYLIYNSLLW